MATDDDKPTPGSGDATLTALDPAGVPGGEYDRAPFEPDAEQSAHDRYEVQGEHARGGLGRIMLGFDRKLERTVAVKELLTATPRAAARFEREARITARLEHPGIVPVHDTGLWPDGTRFYTMKLVAGDPLRDVIKECADLSERLALLPNIVAVADTMAYAHSEGVIHRDLKPSNVIVGAFGETIIVDWGLAKDLHEPDPGEDIGAPYRAGASADITLGGEVLGTPAYMSPEQARGEDVDERADVYSLGAMLYDVLAGRSPYSGTTPHSIVDEVVQKPPPPVDQDVAIRADLVAIVEHAMARDAADRYANAGELREDLQRYLAGQLVRAHRYSMAQRVVRRVRRALVPIALAIAVFAVGSAVLYNAMAGQHTAADPCASAAEPIDGIFAEPQREAIRAAFDQVGADAASARFDAVAEGLDARVTELRGRLIATCRTRTTTAPGGDVHRRLDAREQCLSRRADELEATIALLSRADEDVFSKAEDAVGSLIGVDACTDDEALLSAQELPDDPAQREVARGLWKQIAEARALAAAGKFTASAELAAEVVAASERLEFSPLTAFAYRRLIASLDLSSNHKEVVRLSRPAVEHASRAGNDDLVADLLGDYIYVLDDKFQKHDQADALLWQYELAIGRTRSVHVRGDAMLILGNLALQRKRYDDAASYYERSKRLRIDAFGADHPKVAAVVSNIARVHTRQGRYEEALVLHKEALAMRLEHQGPDHPDVAYSYNSIGAVLAELGRYEEELDYYERAVKLRERTLAPDHLDLGVAMFNLGNLLVGREKYARAYEYQVRALAIFEQKLGADHPHVTYPLTSIGEILVSLGRPGEAIEPLERALAIRTERKMALNLMADTRFALGRALWDTKRDRARARRLVRTAVADYRSAVPQSKPIEDAVVVVEEWLATHR